LTLLAGRLHHDPDSGLYTAESSSLGLPPGPPPVLIVVLPPDGPPAPETVRLFYLLDADRHSVGDGIAGWRYLGSGSARLLLIND
jgi:hypothetical protein